MGNSQVSVHRTIGPTLVETGHETFLMDILPIPLISVGQLLVKRCVLSTEACPGKVWLR